jgi:crotonobetainyl-CoA:carnitine CoA-transferase CaiB-like acyl-CoA transferase
VFKNLAAEADVVTENHRPGTMEKCGVGYEDLKAINEGIVLLHISGFGRTGPLPAARRALRGDHR